MAAFYAKIQMIISINAIIRHECSHFENFANLEFDVDYVPCTDEEIAQFVDDFSEEIRQKLYQDFPLFVSIDLWFALEGTITSKYDDSVFNTFKKSPQLRSEFFKPYAQIFDLGDDEIKSRILAFFDVIWYVISTLDCSRFDFLRAVFIIKRDLANFHKSYIKQTFGAEVPLLPDNPGFANAPTPTMGIYMGRILSSIFHGTEYPEEKSAGYNSGASLIIPVLLNPEKWIGLANSCQYPLWPYFMENMPALGTVLPSLENLIVMLTAYQEPLLIFRSYDKSISPYWPFKLNNPNETAKSIESIKASMMPTHDYLKIVIYSYLIDHPVERVRYIKQCFQHYLEHDKASAALERHQARLEEAKTKSPGRPLGNSFPQAPNVKFWKHHHLDSRFSPDPNTQPDTSNEDPRMKSRTNPEPKSKPTH